jgi:putative spermidine/putrescine transport system substrate-binding protein
MKTSRLLAAAAASAVVVAALPACAPPEKRGHGDQTSSGMQVSEATSAADIGGIDVLVGAAKKEGELNVIALPPDWANYGNIITAFQDKYGITVNSAQPDAASQDQINAADQQKRTSTAPDVFDLGQSVALAHTSMFAPYRVSTFEDIPAGYKDPDGAWVNDYGGYMSIGYDTAKVPDVTSVNDLLKPEYSGKVALNGDPTKAGAAFCGVMMVALTQGGSADDIAPGVEFFRKLKQAGNFLPIDPTPATIESGQSPVVSTGNTSMPPRPKNSRHGKLSCHRVTRSPASTSRRSTRTHPTRRRHGCGRSSSTATRAKTCSSAVARARCVPAR